MKSGWLVTVVWISATPLPAAAETRTSADVSLGATAASNPYLLPGDDTGAFGANLQIDPAVIIEQDDTSLRLGGSVNLEKYLERYGLDESMSLSAAGEHRADERTTITADIGFRSSESAARRYFGGSDLAELGPGEFPDTPEIDPTLGSVAGRTSRLDVDVAVEHLTSPNAVLSASAGFGLTRAEAGAGEDYGDSALALSYSRRLRERTSVSVTFDGGYADYLGRQVGDGLYVTGLAGIDHQFSESLYLSAQLGASFSAIEAFAGGRETTVSWAANIGLCDKAPRETLCVTGSRRAQPTSLGGLSTVSSVGVSYALSIGTAGSASLIASYARSSRSQVALGPLAAGRISELANMSGTYRHRIGERVSAFVTPSVTSISDDTSSKRSNYQVVLGASYHFGKLR